MKCPVFEMSLYLRKVPTLKHLFFDILKIKGQIQFKLLLQLCDPVARLCLIFRTSVRKANLFSYILII